MSIIICFLLAGCGVMKENRLQKASESMNKMPSSSDFISVDQEPIPLNIDEFNRKIGYPLPLREAGIIGQVVFRILIDKEGNYVRHEVIRSPHPLLTEAFEKHLSELTFAPAMKEGMPVPFWINLPIQIHPIE